MNKAISYIRFSSASQGGGSTTQRQQDMIDQWLKDHPDVVLSKASEVDTGRSGYHGEHLEHGLGKVLKVVQDGMLGSGDYVLIEAIDRLGRLPPLSMIRIVTNIIEAGVTLVTLEDNQEYTTKSFDEGGLFILAGKVQQAHNYSKNLSRRLKTSWDIRKEKARTGGQFARANCWWLDKYGKIIPDRAEPMRELIELYLKGYGMTRILRELLPKYPDFPLHNHRTLKRWVADPAIMGTWRTQDGESIPNAFDPLVSSGTFHSIQQETKRRVHNPGGPESSYSLTGLMLCGECGSRMKIRRTKYKSTGIYNVYCNCGLYLDKGSDFCTNSKTWPYQICLYAFESDIPSQLGDSQRDKIIEAEQDRLESLINDRKQIDSQLNNAFDLLVEFPGQSNLKAKINTLNERKDNLQSEINSAEWKLIAVTHSDVWPFEEDVEEMNVDVSHYLNDPVAMREKLKGTDFRLTFTDRTLSLSRGTSKDEQYIHLGKSVRHSCHLVHAHIPAHTVWLESDQMNQHHEQYDRWLAIDRFGLMVSAGTEEELMDKLEVIKESGERPLEFGISDFQPS